MLQVNDNVSYTDEHGERKGIIIEINESTQRARIKWNDRKIRTWIRIKALVKLLPVLLILLLASCSKNIDTPVEPVKDYKLVIRCVDYKRDTLIVGRFKIARWHCTKTIIDTIKN